MKLRSQRGQMAIFIALFFQVLFVFFAMAINVGLVVHDKINLQTAVDLAAYYGAQRQGEILNQIAHVNYQMRQNYKLLVWRFRVLGALGMDTHPMNPKNSSGVGGDTPATAVPPTICVTHSLWREYDELDQNSSICRQANLNLINIPQLTGGAGFVPGFNNLVNFVDETRRQFQKQCNEAGVFNWLVAARWLAHYRIDGAARKEMIIQLANQLSQPGDSFQDLRGGSVKEGVERTLRNNLTEANSNDSLTMQYFNSMGQGECANVQTWLPEIRINPVVRFTDLDGTNIDACNASAVPNRETLPRPAVNGFTTLPSGFVTDANLRNRYLIPNMILAQHWATEPTNDLHSSIGFEKNPWCMVYSGVTAQTTVRKPFSPLGGGVSLQARGFAKPFGGRIGPWYGKSWPSGSPNSQAGSRNEQVDPNLPSRDVGGAGGADPNFDLANHSRFPGDQNGMNSMQAISAMAGQKGILTPRSLNWSHYNHLGGMPSMRATGDSLARNALSPAVHRPMELGSVAPDVFDIYYYSIEPAYFQNYFTANATNNGAIFNSDIRIFDFGSTKDGGQPGANQELNVMNQVTNAQIVYGGSVNYIIKDWQHLLTSWTQKGAVDFGFDADRFGRCSSPVRNQEFPATGNCTQGGRTGYGVKPISRDYLLSSDHALAGEGGGGASILNRPPF
ncbi:MAG: Tad domain-containing protein [Bdellovibrionales bacterium]|nr:Tad domain-containing protein [Bdellovibrionales bacterium]